MTPDPTDAELDEQERIANQFGPFDEGQWEQIKRLIKALRTCRQGAKKVKADAWEEGWQLAHEPAKCGHARANYKDPNFGTPEYLGDEKCEACVQIEAVHQRAKAKNAVIEAARGDRVDLSAYRSDLHVYGDPGTLCTALNVWSNQQPEMGDYRKALKIASLYLESIWEALAAPAKGGRMMLTAEESLTKPRAFERAHRLLAWLVRHHDFDAAYGKGFTEFADQELREAEADGFKRGQQEGLEKAAIFEETVCLEGGKLVQRTKDEASIEQQLKAEAIRSRKENPDAE